MEPRELIDNYMLKKIENWKLDDAIRSIIDKERLILVFYLILQIDKIMNDLVVRYKLENGNFELKPQDIHNKLLKILVEMMRTDGCGYIWIKENNKVTVSPANSLPLQSLKIVISFIQRHTKRNKVKSGQIGIKKILKNPIL